MVRFLILSALLLLAACTALAGAAPPLVPSTWTFETIDGGKPVSSKTRLELASGRLSASAGCNGLGGDLGVERDRLHTGPIIGTQMFCDGVMDQERAVAQLLGSSPRFVYQGDRLILTGGRHKAVLRRIS